MPVVWNAETEAKLLAALFKVTDLKVTAAQMKEIAEIISPDCTPKAISHRLSKFRLQAASFSGGKKGGSEGPKTPKKGAAAKGKGSVGRKRKGRGEDDDDEEVGGGGKRAKVGEEDEDGEGEEGEVRVKGEDGEDGEDREEE